MAADESPLMPGVVAIASVTLGICQKEGVLGTSSLRILKFNG